MRLDKISTCPPDDINKKDIEDETRQYQKEIGKLQVKMFAQNKKSLLVVMQGMDAAGKGGAVRETFRDVNPMGCRVLPFKKPSDEEFAHDFLWRVHERVPKKGMIHVFDRSHYEDVLIQRVKKWIDMDRVHQRYKHINNFESLLIEENNTTIIKFYLHVSRDEQLERLKERMTNPDKMWKYNKADFEEREHWDKYMDAYEDVFEYCNEAAPWYIVPTDKNWYKEYFMAKTVCETMRKMDLFYPEINF